MNDRQFGSTTPRFSVFTPSHDPRWLDQCFESLVAQTTDDWEWIVVLNGGASWKPPRRGYPVLVIDMPRRIGVGEAKRLACEWANGEILVELDHDDLLTSGALEAIGDAFDRNPGAALVYSHWGQILDDGSPDPSQFAASAGWTYRTGDVDGRQLTFAQAMAPTPHNVSYIWFAPNHVRAFRASSYNAAGGYDRTLDILDDQELMARLYLQGDFVLVDECLYLQRMHGRNTHRDASINERIQSETVALYDTHFERTALAWAARASLDTVEWRADELATPGYSHLHLVERSDSGSWGTGHFADSSVGVIRLEDVLHLVADPVALMNELYRILAPGGVIITGTPSTDGRGAFQHPCTRSYWNENSFWYYTEDAYARRIPGLEARFQVSRAVTIYPSEWHEVRSLAYVFVNLIALKEGTPRNGGALLATAPSSGAGRSGATHELAS